ncbi:MAG TPA: S8 family serine peptidase [Desulfuromonadales bacterium]|nr:S8 family serine peptidase [Desulfuromonadales bacterium]
MKNRIHTLAWSLVLVMSFVCSGFAAEGTPQPKFKPGEVLIKYKPHVSEAEKDRKNKRHGSHRIRYFKELGIEHSSVATGESVEQAVRRLQNDPDVEFAEPDYLIKASALPNDPDYSRLWGMQKINAPAAWDITTGSSSVVVAIIDSGIDYNHPDLAANIWPGLGYNSITGSNDPMDDNGHGTHVAGTIGGVGNNGSGVAGVNWNVKLMACKFLDSTGSGWTSNAIACLNYIRNQKNQGVNIVASNNSWGSESASSLLEATIAAQKDILFIAAAGNGRNNNVVPNNNDVIAQYPAAYDLPNLITVAATDSNDDLTFFSNYGKRSVAVAAPGYDIYSTYLNGGYENLMGTSMAAPHVTGLAALLRAQDPTREWYNIRNLILTGGDDVAALAEKTLTGKRINASGSTSCSDRPFFRFLNTPDKLIPGVAAILRILSINCDRANGPLGLTMSDGTAVPLRDDGITPDQDANDGIFTASWVPTATSQGFTLTTPGGSQNLRVPALRIDTTLPPGFLNQPYNVQPPVSGGLLPYGQWLITSGSLPPGMDLNPETGILGGAPSLGGTYTFTVQVTDAELTTVSRSLTLTVYESGIIQEWLKYGVTGNLASDSSGNLYVANGSLTKYDPAGNQLWTVASPAAGMIKIDANDNIYIASASGAIARYDATGVQTWAKQVAGYTLNALTLDPTGSIYFAAVSTQNYVLKYDPQGALQATLPAGTGSSPAIAVDGSGNASVVSYEGTAIKIVHLDSAGVVLWTRSYKWNTFESLRAVSLDSAGNLYVVGASNPYYLGFGYVFKVDMNGNLLWRADNPTMDLRAISIVDDILYVTGTQTDGTTTNRPVTLRTKSYDSDGRELWAVTLPQGVIVGGISLTVDKTGKLYVAGTSDGNTFYRATGTGSTGILKYSLIFNIPPVTPPSASTARAYGFKVPVIGGTRPFIWSVVTGSLPSGLSIDPNSGVINGIATAVGASTFTLQATDAVNAKTTREMTINVYGSPRITASTIPNGLAGYEYGYTFPAEGGLAPYTWVLVSGDLPAGTGIYGDYLYGYPAAKGVYLFTMRATDALGASDTKLLSFTVNEPVTITTTSLANSSANIPYSQTVTATGGVLPYTWSIAGGALPDGVVLDSATGLVSGTPTVASSFYFVVQATDAVGVIAQAGYTVLVYEPLAITVGPVTGYSNTGYSSSLQATGGVPPYVWSITNGSLAPGLTLDPASGVITGVPTTEGVFPFTLSVSDSSATVVSQVTSIAIDYTGPVITPPRGMTYMTVGKKLTFALTASGGIAPYQWSLGSAAPAGLTIDPATGVITGIPMVADNYSVEVILADARQNSVSYFMPLAVVPNGGLTALWGKADSSQGMTVDAAGNIYTVYDTVGRYNWGYPPSTHTLLIVKYDPTGKQLWSRTFSGGGKDSYIRPGIASEPSGSIYISSFATGMLYKYDTNGNPVWSKSVPAVAVSGALSVDKLGNIAIASDKRLLRYSPAGAIQLDLTASANINAVTSDSVGNIYISTSSFQKFSASGQSLWQANQTNPYGVTGGVPVLVTDDSGNLFAAYECRAGICIDTFDSSTGTARLVVSNGANSYENWYIPQHFGLVMAGKGHLILAHSAPDWSNSTDAIVSVYSTAGLFLGAVNYDSGGNDYTTGVAIDGNGNIISSGTQLRKFSFAMGPVITSTTLPEVFEGVAFSQPLTAVDGTAPYIWSTTEGALPAGYVLDCASGVISGSTSAYGTYNPTIQVTDAAGKTATGKITITVLRNLGFAESTIPAFWSNYYGNANITAVGGHYPYTIEITNGAIPVGLVSNVYSNDSLKYTVLRIYGAATEVVQNVISLKVTDSRGLSVTRDFTIVVNEQKPFTYTYEAPPVGTVGEPYSMQVKLSGGIPPYMFIPYYNTNVPPGLVINTDTGVISGTPTTAGNSGCLLFLRDSAGHYTFKYLSFTVNPALGVSPAIPFAQVNVPYSGQLSPVGGTAPFTWQLANSTALPQGLSLDPATGLILGTVSAIGSYTFDIQISDSTGKSAIGTVTLEVVTPLAITTSTLATGKIGDLYNQTLTPVGGKASYNWTITTGTLPPGLTLDAATGVISGTPTNFGTSSFTLQVTDSLGGTASTSSSIDIASNLTIATTTLTNGTVNCSYSQTLAASGGAAPYVWNAAALPNGLVLDPASGTVSGIPVSHGSSTITITVTDSQGAAVSVTLVITIDPAPLVITATPPTGGITGVAYNQTLSANGGVAPYNWIVSSGALPTGLSLGTNGTISGAPTTGGTATFTAQITDSKGISTSQTFTVTIASNLSVNNTTFAGGISGSSYSQNLAASGGYGGYSWSLASGTLPGGLTLNTNGTISGIPTAAGSSSFSVKATDAGGNSAISAPFSIAILEAAPVITTGSLASGIVGTAYSQTITATGGTSPLTWSITSGTLPGGLTLNSTTGVISGTPTAAVTASSITIQATDASNRTSSKTLSMTITAAVTPLTVTTTTLPDGYLSSAYSSALTASGGMSPYSWSITSTLKLPAGLTLNTTTGVISGTPTAAVTNSSITFQVKDAAATIATKVITISTYSLPTISTTSLANGTVGAAYSSTLAATGGKTAYSWSITSGTLPAGLTLNAVTGAITGTPTIATAATSITFKASDANGKTASKALSITINTAPLAVATTALPDGYLTTFYSSAIAATGGKAPYTWSITSTVKLPAGLTLNTTTGVISGTPSTVVTNSSITFQVKDAAATIATKVIIISTYSLPAISTASLANGTVGATYSATLAASGGKSAYSWSITSGTLPAGLTLSTTGVISGTPTTATAATGITFQVTDANGKTASKALNITVSAAPLAVTQLNSWTNLYSAAPGNTSATGLTAGSISVGTGTNRLLLVAVALEIGTTANPTVSASLGGVALTQIKVTNSTQREIIWVGYLKEGQIGSGSKAITVSYGGATGNVSALHVKWAAFSGVNQTTPVVSSGGQNTATTSATFGSTINYVAGGMTTVVSANGGTPATAALIATPAFIAGTGTTSNAQSSTSFTSARHAAAGSYAATTAVTWSGTTSSRSATVAVSLQP